VPTTIEPYIFVLRAGAGGRRASYGARAPAGRALGPRPRADARPSRHNALVPRFWIAMQIVIVICVIISAVIVVVKL
jgi:hypothetical protein